MTLLAVTRQSRDGRNRIGTIGRCGVGSGSFGRCSGDCWPASHMVALAGVAASGREYAIRVRGRATTVIPRPPPRAFPANLGPTERRSAAPPMAGRAMLSSGHTCCWRVASGRAPLTLRPSVLHAKDHQGWRTRGMRIEPAGLAKSIGTLTTWTQARAFPRPSSKWWRRPSSCSSAMRRAHAGEQG